MSNRRETGRARRARETRNGYRRSKTLGAVIQLHRPTGELARAEGARNYPYPTPGTGMKRGLDTIHADAARPRRFYPDHSRDGEKRVMLEGMTRDRLRAIFKAQNVKGYGKMNKAELVEAALR